MPASPKIKMPSAAYRYGYTVECPELVGQEFGSVKITGPVVRVRKRRTPCGKMTYTRYVVTKCQSCKFIRWCNLASLRQNRSRGCRNCNVARAEYPRWLYQRVAQQKARCDNPDSRDYPNYGGRGIEFRFDGVRDAVAWLMQNLNAHEFRNLEIDRIENDEHYEAGNLQLVSHGENQRNKRTPQTVRLHRFRRDYPRVSFPDADVLEMIDSGFCEWEIAGRWDNQKRGAP